MLIRRAVELFTPTQCLGCGCEGVVLCLGCRAAALAQVDEVCFRCHRPSARGQTCGACSSLTPLSGCLVAARYEGAVKDLIWQLKFHRLQAAARVAAELVLAAMPEGQTFDVVSAVPIAPGRYRERGYNQAALVAKRVAARLDLPYAELLGRTSALHQLGSDRATRLAQVKGAFYPVRVPNGRRVLLVDDVVTTGATLEECARTLLTAGAREVWGAAVARH